MESMTFCLTVSFMATLDLFVIAAFCVRDRPTLTPSAPTTYQYLFPCHYTVYPTKPII